jgi:hypothetical protein
LNGLLTWLQLADVLVLFTGTSELLPAIVADGCSDPASRSDGLLVFAAAPAAELLVFVTLLLPAVFAADGGVPPQASELAAASSKAHD